VRRCSKADLRSIAAGRPGKGLDRRACRALLAGHRRMEDANSLIAQRKASLAKLREKGLDPFRNKFKPGIGCGEARAKYVAGEWKEGQHVEIAGRITAHRDMGKSQFMDLRDGSGRIQIYAQKQTLGDEPFDLFKHLDLADFIGVKGEMFTTKAGEPSVKITSFVILAKALRPPPAKWHGLEDTEIRYRQRYLDLMANEEVRQTFLKRSAIVHEIRQFFHGRGYVEVETPAMQAIPGGAAAAPFKTFHNALGCDFFLRIALELYHKRLLVGGIDRLFEIGKNFRNEGLSRKHNPEFTMLEAYCAFGDYESMMETVEGLVTHVAMTVLKTMRIPTAAQLEMTSALLSSTLSTVCDTRDLAVLAEAPHAERLREFRDAVVQLPRSIDTSNCHNVATRLVSAVSGITNTVQSAMAKWGPNAPQELYNYAANILLLTKAINSNDALLSLPDRMINLERPWQSKKYKDLVREKAGADWFDIPPAERRQRAHDLGAEIGHDYEDFEITGAVFEKLIEPTLIQPTFVTHLPRELVPLAKRSPDDPTTVEVFECCINGQEIAPGYTEQNDPIQQRDTLEHQAGGEQQKLDEDFLVALEHGMPPAGGIGIGIDRLCMMLLGQESIRDVILFPQLKPK
jgi:lysyl-tRNA synthetase class 2